MSKECDNNSTHYKKKQEKGDHYIFQEKAAVHNIQYAKHDIENL